MLVETKADLAAANKELDELAVTGESFGSILHKTHGWIAAPDGLYFQQRGKMVYLMCDTTEELWLERLYHYPFGTSWRLTSILAFGG